MPLMKPSKAGIFLYQEVGKVSFYNKNDISFLYFNGYFTQALWPYSYAGTDSETKNLFSNRLWKIKNMGNNCFIFYYSVHVI